MELIEQRAHKRQEKRTTTWNRLRECTTAARTVQRGGALINRIGFAGSAPSHSVANSLRVAWAFA
jgi:hypothetical protein